MLIVWNSICNKRVHFDGKSPKISQCYNIASFAYLAGTFGFPSLSYIYCLFMASVLISIGLHGILYNILSLRVSSSMLPASFDDVLKCAIWPRLVLIVSLLTTFVHRSIHRNVQTREKW